MASLVLTTASAHAELVVHYKLDEASGTVASDATVNGNHGTVVSPTWEVDTTGLTDPTSTTGVSMLAGSLLSGVTGLGAADDTFTIMFWLQSDDFVDETFARFFSIGNDTGGQSEAIFAFVLETAFDEDQVEVVYYPLVPDMEGESTVFTIEPNPLTTGWHHHAAVVDGLDLSYYIDGTLRNSGTMAGALTNSEFYILGSPTQSSNGVSASIDEVGVFDTALSQSEISGFMTNGLEGTPSAADPEITSITVAGGIATIMMKGTDGTDYTCESSIDLVDWALDGSAPNPINTTSSTASFDVAAGDPKKFYRIAD